MFKLSTKIFVAFFLRGLGAVAGLSLSLVITNTLAIENAGHVFFCLTILTVVAIIFGLGYQEVVQRFIAAYASEKKWSDVNNVYRVAMSRTVIAGFFGSVALIVISKNGPQFFSKLDFFELLFLISPGVLFLTVLNLQARAFQSLSYPNLTIIFTTILVPTLFSLMIWSLNITTVDLVVLTYVASLFIACMLSLFLWWRHPWVKVGNDVFPSTMKKNARELWIVSVSRLTANWGTQLVAGFFILAENFAHLAVAQRVAVLISFVLIAANIVVAPLFASLWHKKDIDGLKSLAQNATLIIATVAIILLILSVGFSQKLFSIFGSEYGEAQKLFRVLLLGQFVNAICGSVLNLLMMTGNESSIKQVTLSFSILTIILALIFIPLYGVYAAVWVSTIVMAMQNIVMLCIVKKKLGFWMFGLPNVFKKLV